MRLIRRTPRDEDGSATLELAVLAPALLLFIIVVIFAGRVAIAGQAVQQAAEEAAREASISRSYDAAESAAGPAAERTLQQQSLQCEGTPDVNTHDLADEFATAVGQDAKVTVTVTCKVRLSDLAFPGIPGSRTVSATSVSPLDTYRER